MINVPLILYAGLFPVWIVFFVLGLYLGKNRIKTSIKYLIILTIVGLVISVVETYYSFYITDSFKGLGIKIGAFIYSFAIILLLFSLNTSKTSNSIFWKFLVYLGKISFGVYLIHIFVLHYFVRRVALTFNISNYFINQLFLITLTIVFCTGIIAIGRKINKSLTVKYLGF